jgi:hypothetical protein
MACNFKPVDNNLESKPDHVKKHYEPRTNIHEIPKIINFLGKTLCLYDEAKEWEQYYHQYLNYNRLMNKYIKDMHYFKNGLLNKEPRKPYLPSEPKPNYDRKIKPYKRPNMFQNASVSFGGKNYSQSYYNVKLIEVEKLEESKNGITMTIPTVEIPAELSDYLESE